jgi:outer membrane protein OmpA-like peptidoglycan-associated protein
MLVRSLAIGFAVLQGTVPATAQQGGTIEFGAFGSATSFDKELNLRNGFGGGGRIGVFLGSRWSLEFESGAMRASRLGLRSVNVSPITGRVTVTPAAFNRLWMLVGAGITRTNYQFVSSYGFSGLLGTRLAFSPNVALRVDGVADFMSRDHTNLGIRVGVSFFRRPSAPTRTPPVIFAAGTPQPPDSNAAAPRSPAVHARSGTLRDTLRPSLQVANLPPTKAARATMEAMIHFPHDRSDLSDSAKTILDEKVEIFRTNPTIRIVIVGHASDRGTAIYNEALGLRRARAAKDYLVAQGIEQGRIEIDSRGNGQPLVAGAGELAAARPFPTLDRLRLPGDPAGAVMPPCDLVHSAHSSAW